MFSAVNGKIGGVMLRKFSRHPARIGGMAFGATGGEVCALVVRIEGRRIIRLVAGHAFIGCRRIVAGGMACRTIGHFMALGQREEIMIYLIGRPVEPVHVVTLAAIGRETRPGMVRVGGGRKVTLVAIDAIVADPLEG